MKILAIVVTYNGVKWIDKCFNSLINSSTPIHILVIDNASTDNTPLIINNKFPTVEIIETGQNLGFGKANNIGLKKAVSENYDYAFLLNQDAWVETDTIEKLINIYRNNLQFGILAPLQLNGNGTLIDQLFFEYSITPCRELISDLLITKANTKNVYITPFVNAACWLLPLTTINKVGGFDPLYPHYGEDDDYINRVKNKTMKIGICPELKVFHDREFRTKNKEWNKLVNTSFIKLLVDLKNNNKSLPSKRHYFKLFTLHLIKSLASKNKKLHKVQYHAIWKIIHKYDVIIDHRRFETEVKPHYLF